MYIYVCMMPYLGNYNKEFQEIVL